MFQQGSSDWCIMSTLKKTPENRLSISWTTLITTVLEQNCSVKQCCSYFSFTLSTSNGLHESTLDFQECNVNGVCRHFPGTWFRRSVKYSWSETCFICTQTWGISTLSEGQENSKSRIQEFVQGTILIIPSCPWHSHLQPPGPLRAEGTMPNNQELPNISLYKLHSVWPSMQIQALDFSMGFKSHGPFGAFGVVS